MEKKRDHSFKRAAAGALAVLTVAAYSLPANIVAQAAGELMAVNEIEIADDGYINNGDGTHSPVNGGDAEQHTLGDIIVEAVDANTQYTFNQSTSSDLKLKGSWKANNMEKTSSTAAREWNVTVPNGSTLLVYYMVSSQTDKDTLTISAKKDNENEYTVYLNKAGNGADGILELSAGTYSLKAEYTKDTSYINQRDSARGIDTAYIRFVKKCVKCDYHEDTLHSLLTIDGILNSENKLANDFAFVGASATASTAYDVNGTYWFDGECTIYSNYPLAFGNENYANGVRTSADDATLRLAKKDIVINDKEYKFQYILRLKNPAIARNVVLVKGAEISDNLLNISASHIYDGNKPVLSELTLAAAEGLDDENNAKITSVLASADTEKEISWYDDEVNAGNTIFGKLSLYNAEMDYEYAQDFECAITKRDAYVTPAGNQSKVYGEEAEDIEYSIEAENGNRGVIAADINEDFDIEFGLSNEEGNIEFDQFSNAGTYSYVLTNGGDFQNYNFTIAADSPVYTVLPKDITELNINLDGKEFIYDREFHTPAIIASDAVGNTFEMDRDYQLGGDARRRAVGDYTIQIWGKGNYTGFVSKDWSISKEKGYIEIIKSSKIYDGTDITDMFEINTADFDADDNYSIKYFDVDWGEYLEAAPSDAGSYSIEVYNNNELLNSDMVSILPRPFNASDIKVALAENPSIIANDDDWTYAPQLTVTDGDKVLVEGTEDETVYDEELDKEVKNVRDYYAYAARTKLPGTYLVEIVGAGNYNGYISTEWTVTEDNSLNNAISLSDAVLYNGKARFTTTPDVPEGYTAVESGIIFLKENTANITEANAKSALISNGTKKSATVATYNKVLNISPVGDQPIWAMGYIVVEKDGVQATIYTEPKTAKVSALVAADDSVRAELSDAVLNNGKASFSSKPVFPEGCNAIESGIIFIKENTADITAENAKSVLIASGTKKAANEAANTKVLNISAVNDQTIWAMGYITIDVNGTAVTKYSEVKSAKVSDLTIAAAGGKVDFSEPSLYNGKARFTSVPVIPAGYTAVESGIIFIKENTANITAENAKSVLIASGTKKAANEAANTKVLNISAVDDQTIWAIGYLTVSKDNQTYTIYSAAKSAKISEMNQQ